MTQLSTALDALRRFSPPLGSGQAVQLLTPAGRLVADDPFVWDGSLDDARAHLRALVLVRRLDHEGMMLQRQGKLSLWGELKGQEAVQVGIAAALSPDDYVFPSYREHGLAMLMGLPTSELLSTWASTEFCNWKAEPDRFHAYQFVIGAQTLQAVGYAMGMALDDEPGATIVFHGDGAISQGDVNEAYAFAASYQAPVVFVCTNNQWAISEPVALQSRVPLYQRAWGFGIPSVQVDGNDVLAMREVAAWALEHARSGKGPVMIEAFTFRMGGHTTADDPTRYRSRDEVEAWAKRDPILRLQTWLEAQGAWSDADAARLEAEADALGERVRAEVAALQPVTLPEMFDHLFADKTDELAAQQAEAADA